MAVLRATPEQLKRIREAHKASRIDADNEVDGFWILLAELAMLIGYGVVRDYLDGSIDEDTVYKLYRHAKIVRADDKLDAILAARMAQAEAKDFEQFVEPYQKGVQGE